MKLIFKITVGWLFIKNENVKLVALEQNEYSHEEIYFIQHSGFWYRHYSIFCDGVDYLGQVFAKGKNLV